MAMAEEKRCTGRCEMCTPNQRTYCAAQKAYYMEQDIADIKRLLISQNVMVDTIITKEDTEFEEK